MLGLPFTASRLQVASYLCLVALFSISFLVFLNASISFVITERIGRRSGVGDAVGSLSFADELVALVFCPIWGAASDRIGVRAVAVIGYSIVGLGLWSCIWARQVYPGLLLARMVFAVGGSATATMVTAILPNMTQEPPKKRADGPSPTPSGNTNRHSMAPSVSSELTITPERFHSHAESASKDPPKDPIATSSRLAGFVGTFTGLGALIALFVFLPLPTSFEKRTGSASEAVAASFYLVGGVAYLVALGCFFGLRNLPGEEEKSPLRLLRWLRSFRGQEGSSHASSERLRHPEDTQDPTATRFAKSSILSGPRSLWKAFTLAFQSPALSLGYLGGFVARASSVAITLFIPLASNAHFIAIGECSAPDANLPEAPGADLKHTCARAYRLAAALSGVSQLVALLCAPIFGYVSATAGRQRGPWKLPGLRLFSRRTQPSSPSTRGRRHMRTRSGRIRRSHNGPPNGILGIQGTYSNWYHWPLLLASVAGIVGYGIFAALPSPEPSGEDGSPAVFVAVILMGICQIGAIVCSLGLLTRGIQGRPDSDIKRPREDTVASGDSDALATSSSAESSAPATPTIVVRPSSSSSATYPINTPPRSVGAQNGSHQPPSEQTPLLRSQPAADGAAPSKPSHEEFKGAIAGIYSHFGGLAILLLTKLGGLAFDQVSPASPFLIMVAANAVLLFVGIFLGLVGAVGREQLIPREPKEERHDVES